MVYIFSTVAPLSEVRGGARGHWLGGQHDRPTLHMFVCVSNDCAHIRKRKDGNAPVRLARLDLRF